LLDTDMNEVKQQTETCLTGETVVCDPLTEMK
jgi:hypothetical protein